MGLMRVVRIGLFLCLGSLIVGCGDRSISSPLANGGTGPVNASPDGSATAADGSAIPGDGPASTPEASTASCTAAARSSYTLVRTRSLAAPVPNPTGIAFDGQELWIMRGAGASSSSSTLVRFDPDTLVVDRTFTFDNLQETVGSGVFGITWDGQAIWIAVNGNTDKLVRVDPNSGQIIRTMSSPADLGPSDLDFDGTNLWLSSGTGEVFVLDPTTGGVVRTLPIPPDFLGRDDGVAVRPCEVWIGGLFGGLGVENSSSGAVVASALQADGTAFTSEGVGSSVFIGGQLVIAGQLGINYYDLQ
jgi:hypothetical protein